jgi:hypothetical protein
LGLVEEAGVLDGYDGLVGKNLEQIDLSIGERAKPAVRGTVLGIGIGPWWATTGRESPSTLWIAAS